MLFVGTYEHTIDAKRRLAIPSDIRRQLERSGEGEELFALIQDGALCLYTKAGLVKRAEELDHSEWERDALLEYEEFFFSQADRVEIDKQGRVRLPERLLERAGVGRDTVLIGVKDHMQVHDREAWEAKIEKLRAERPDLLMNPRRAMRARGGER